MIKDGCREDVYGPLGLVPRAQLWVYKAGFTSRACWVGVYRAIFPPQASVCHRKRAKNAGLQPKKEWLRSTHQEQITGLGAARLGFWLRLCQQPVRRLSDPPSASPPLSRSWARRLLASHEIWGLLQKPQFDYSDFCYHLQNTSWGVRRMRRKRGP